MPDNSADSDMVAALAEEYLLRHRRGERPRMAEYVSRYPHLADEICAFFPTMGLVEWYKPESDDHRDTLALDAAGARLGDFRIIREVGRGGMGVVYEADQESLGRRVALKILNASRLHDPKVSIRFNREAKAAARLHHTNIVPVFGVGEAEGHRFYVMQFIQGLDLGQILDEIRRLPEGAGADNPNQVPSTQTMPTAKEFAQSLVNGQHPATQNGSPGTDSNTYRSDHVGDGPTPFTPSQPGRAADLTPPVDSTRRYARSVARLGIQVAEALDHAHEQGILHRDVKPSNLLLDARGTIWVTDFGLAKIAAEDDLTRTGDVVGTIRYMAPERFRGLCDARSDIYALGLTLYELMAKRPAFEARDRNALIQQVTQTEPRRLDCLGRSTPKDLATVIHKAIARDPADRYRRASELADDLKRFLEDLPIAARRTGPVELAWRWCRRNPLVASSLGLVVLMMVTGLITALATAHRFNKIAKAESEARKEAIRRADDTAEVVRFFVNDMLRSAEPEKQQGRVVSVNEVLDRADRSIEGRFAGRPLVEATIRQTQGMVYFELGEYDKARGHVDLSLALRTKHLGLEHPDTLSVAHDLASVLNGGFRHYAEARRLYERTLALRRRVLGPEHPDTYTTMLNLGVLLNGGYRNPKEAVKLIEPVLKARRDSLGPEHPKTIEAKHHLADALLRAIRIQEARDLFDQEIASLRRVLGPEHSQTLQAMAGLAKCHTAENRPDEAEALYQQILAIRQRVLGPEHPSTLASLADIAGVYTRQGRLDESESMYRQALETERRARGTDHPQMFWALDGLADVVFRRGRAEEAEALLDQALEIRKRVLGPEHPDTLVAMGFLSNLLFKQGRRGRALELDENRLAIYQRVQGFSQTQMLNAMNGLAWHLVGVPDPDLGDREIARATDLAKTIIEGSPQRGDFWNTLGVARYRGRDWDGAIAALMQADRLSGDRLLGHNAFFLAMAHFRRGDEAKARDYFDRAAKWTDEKKSGDGELRQVRSEAEALLGSTRSGDVQR